MKGWSFTDDAVRFGEDEEEADRDDDSVVARGQRGEHYEERLIGHSRQHVASSHECGDASRELPDDLIDRLTVRGFPQLPKMVDLHGEETDRTLVAPGEGDRLIELYEGEVASGQARDLVDQAERPQLVSRVAEAHQRRAVGEHQNQEGLTVRFDPRVAKLDPHAIAYFDQGLGPLHELAEVLLRCLRQRPTSDRRRR